MDEPYTLLHMKGNVVIQTWAGTAVVTDLKLRKVEGVALVQAIETCEHGVVSLAGGCCFIHSLCAHRYALPAVHGRHLAHGRQSSEAARSPQ